MATYLSDFRGKVKETVSGVVAGTSIIDSLSSSLYRTIRYNVTAEDAVNGSMINSTFTVSHDSLEEMMTEFNTFGDSNITFDVVYGNVVGGYPTTLDVKATFPTGFSGSYTFTREVFINTDKVQKIGSDGPSAYLVPSIFLYPSS